ncbi:hypothetical protein FJW05_10390 [Mesorhizobium sp. B2-9-1]|uniref:hypothetical protein n=1 Tax=unclassified Mesorhizobium TaxID=325217 RepID=UPI00112C96C6|nr:MULTISPECIES: hypothetical protein [unclassified Mesorhizobium]TPI47387.1 hypothetical protein FJW05_10390 [Mesorhizobium sp. B2-9-1]TPJ23537.1 hypothetical protein FJ425_21570 [Mesorhizobium sp. B2-7-2]
MFGITGKTVKKNFLSRKNFHHNVATAAWRFTRKCGRQAGETIPEVVFPQEGWLKILIFCKKNKTLCVLLQGAKPAYRLIFAAYPNASVSRLTGKPTGG